MFEIEELFSFLVMFLFNLNLTVFHTFTYSDLSLN